MMTAALIEERLLKQFPTAKIKLNDMTGGGDHWQASIEAEEFRGLTLVQQHQLVSKALGEWMKREIHALALNTKPL